MVELISVYSNRALMTAKPTCELLKKEPQLLPFAHEDLAWKDFTVPKGDGRTWVFHDRKSIMLFNTPEIRSLGDQWYSHPAFSNLSFQKGVERIYTEADAFLQTLGYQHIRYTGKYQVTAPNDQRIAVFAHQGFGLAFLSCLLDIPYPQFCSHFDLCHSSFTVVEFEDKGGYAVPKILTLSSDSHIYREGLPTRYNNCLYF